MDEMIDVLDELTGEKTGEVILKSEAHKTGIWHGSVHILIVNNDRNKTLLQKRCADKKLYPNTWDIAVGGHISTGEDDITSAKREIKEELGLNPDELILEKVDRTKEKLNNNGVISNEYVSIFIIYADIDTKDIQLQVEEVSDVRWCTKEELNSFIANKEIIPHVRDYEILNEMLDNQKKIIFK